MSADQTVAPYVFVVDTDQYSGNFERPMVAFMTGAVGECEVGNTEQELFEENGEFVELADKTSSQPDEDGCYRPAAIWTTPGRYNDGNGKHYDGEPKERGRFPAYESVAVFFDERPTAEEIEFMKRRAAQFVQYWHDEAPWYRKHVPMIAIRGFRMIEQQVTAKEIVV